MDTEHNLDGWGLLLPLLYKVYTGTLNCWITTWGFIWLGFNFDSMHTNIRKLIHCTKFVSGHYSLQIERKMQVWNHIIITDRKKYLVATCN